MTRPRQLLAWTLASWRDGFIDQRCARRPGRGGARHRQRRARQLRGPAPPEPGRGCLSHAALPGIALAFLLTGARTPSAAARRATAGCSARCVAWRSPGTRLPRTTAPWAWSCRSSSASASCCSRSSRARRMRPGWPRQVSSSVRPRPSSPATCHAWPCWRRWRRCCCPLLEGVQAARLRPRLRRQPRLSVALLEVLLTGLLVVAISSACRLWASS